jgi:hypothetical protein
MTNQEFLINKYHLDITKPNPIIVPEAGRVELLELFKDLGFKVGVEIGVQRGDYAEQMLKAIPGLQYYGVDAWTHYEGYRDIRASKHGQAGYDDLFNRTSARLAPYGAHLIRKWSVDAHKDFPDSFFDFVYIDGNHEFEHVTEDIANWSKKVKKGGIISGHDYARIHRWHLKLHCKDVVDGWTASHNIKPLFVFTKDGSPNWLWFNQ